MLFSTCFPCADLIHGSSPLASLSRLCYGEIPQDGLVRNTWAPLQGPLISDHEGRKRPPDYSWWARGCLLLFMQCFFCVINFFVLAHELRGHVHECDATVNMHTSRSASLLYLSHLAPPGHNCRTTTAGLPERMFGVDS